MTRFPDSIAVAIPTKNRPKDLDTTVESVFSQTVRPTQLIVIDQSQGSDSEDRITSRHNALPTEERDATSLKYLKDASITGLTAARNRSLALVEADIVLFLDDDVILEPLFIEQVLATYRDHPDAAGVSGIITNYSPPPKISRLWSRIFMRGPFWDDRQPVYWNAAALTDSRPVRVTRLGGGLMSFRMSAIRGFQFDENLTGACDGEDVEFCAQLGPKAVLMINPAARLVHNHSPSGRVGEHWLRRHARTMWYLYRRNWNCGIFNRLCLVWLNLGLITAAAGVCLRRASINPCLDLTRSIRESSDLVSSR